MVLRVAAEARVHVCNPSRGYKHKSLAVDYICEQNFRNKESQLKILNQIISSIENVLGNKY